MKKVIFLTILISLFATQFVFAQAESARKQIDLGCLTKAVEKRENALISAYETFSAEIKSALEKRKADLITAWGINNWYERNKARINAWNNFRKAKREATRKYNATVRKIWREFHQEAKNCKVITKGIEPETTDLSPEQ
jgi:hypothetical protein